MPWCRPVEPLWILVLRCQDAGVVVVAEMVVVFLELVLAISICFVKVMCLLGVGWIWWPRLHA